jgi:hypothetical protein
MMRAELIRTNALLKWRRHLQTSGIYRASAIPAKNKTGGSAVGAASRPGLAPKSALGLHPCRALSSASVSISVENKIRPQVCNCRRR